MCTMWYIHDGINFSQYGLEQLDIPATERIKLAQQYELYNWVAPAIQELLKLPLNSLSNDDLNHINLHVYSIIARAKEAMERQCKIIAAFPLLFQRTPTTSKLLGAHPMQLVPRFGPKLGGGWWHVLPFIPSILLTLTRLLTFLRPQTTEEFPPIAKKICSGG